MRIKLLQAYEGRQPGELTEVLRSKAADLVQRGIAEIHDDQSPTILPLKKPEPEQPQNITVNNNHIYVNAEELDGYLPDMEESEEVEPEKQFNRIFNLKNKD